jgi:hypothetical protein
MPFIMFRRDLAMTVSPCLQSSPIPALDALRNVRSMATTKVRKPKNDELRPEYDLSTLGPGVRGKYHEKASAGTNLVLLDPDVAEVFPTQKSVNSALRMLAELAEAASAGPRRKRRSPS